MDDLERETLKRTEADLQRALQHVRAMLERGQPAWPAREQLRSAIIAVVQDHDGLCLDTVGEQDTLVTALVERIDPLLPARPSPDEVHKRLEAVIAQGDFLSKSERRNLLGALMHALVELAVLPVPILDKLDGARA